MDFAKLSIIIFLLAILVIILLVKNRKLKEFRIPDCGETRQNRVFVSINDMLYEKATSQTPTSSIKNHIYHDFEGDLDIPIGIVYYAISRNGRFLIKIKNEEIWVQPSECYKEYKMKTHRSK